MVQGQSERGESGHGMRAPVESRLLGQLVGTFSVSLVLTPFSGILLVPGQLRALASGGFPHRSNDSCQELPELRVST